MNHRREPRVEMNVDVTVWGMDRNGKPFVQHARTLNATRNGARLLGLDCVAVGETIGIQYGGKKSRFKIVWVGREDTTRAGQVGVQCLENKILFMTDQPARAEFDPARFGGYSTGAETQQRLDVPSRRKHPRYHCTGGVELRRPQGGHPIWANLSDLSLTGCYVETVSTLPAGSQLLFQLRFQEQVIRGGAIVKTSHHAVGMGLLFQNLSADDKQRLELMLTSLEGNPEIRNQQKFALEVPQGVSQPPMPAPMVQRFAAMPSSSTQPVGQTSTPPPIPARAPETAAPLLSIDVPLSTQAGGGVGLQDRLMRAIAELGELEHCLVQDKVDARLLGQFHDSLEHTRQIVRTIKRFLDLRSGGGDAFSTIPQVEAERMRMFIKLARNVTADIDATSIEATLDFSYLHQAVQQLERRLAKMVPGASNAAKNSSGAR